MPKQAKHSRQATQAPGLSKVHLYKTLLKEYPSYALIKLAREHYKSTQAQIREHLRSRSDYKRAPHAFRIWQNMGNELVSQRATWGYILRRLLNSTGIRPLIIDFNAKCVI